MQIRFLLSLPPAVQQYLEDIKIDLINTDRKKGTFYGDETERNDLLEEARDNDHGRIFWNIYAIDVNNDGQEEYFDRKILYHGLLEESEINWYSLKLRDVYFAEFSSWRPPEYFLTQSWLKKIDGKTVHFSLYHKKDWDSYLLDARIHEPDQTVILLDFMIHAEPKVGLLDSQDTGYSFGGISLYQDPDFEQAFPENIDELASQTAEKIHGEFFFHRGQLSLYPSNGTNQLLLLGEGGSPLQVLMSQRNVGM